MSPPVPSSSPKLSTLLTALPSSPNNAATPSPLPQSSFDLSLWGIQSKASCAFQADVISRDKMRVCTKIQRQIHNHYKTNFNLLALFLGSVSMTVNPSSPVVDETMESSINLRAAIPRIAAATALAVDAAILMLSCPSASPPLPHTSTLSEHTINHSTATLGFANVRPIQMRSIDTLFHKKRILIGDRTGARKSHTTRMTGH